MKKQFLIIHTPVNSAPLWYTYKHHMILHKNVHVDGPNPLELNYWHQKVWDTKPSKTNWNFMDHIIY